MLKELVVEQATPEDVQELLKEVALSRINGFRVRSKLANLFACVEKDRKRVSKVLISADDWCTLRMYTAYDPVNDSSEYKTGHVCDLWGAEFLLRDAGSSNKIELVDEDGKSYVFKD